MKDTLVHGKSLAVVEVLKKGEFVGYVNKNYFLAQQLFLTQNINNAHLHKEDTNLALLVNVYSKMGYTLRSRKYHATECTEIIPCPSDLEVKEQKDKIWKEHLAATRAVLRKPLVETPSDNEVI